MAVRWKYLYSSSIGLHIIALIPIWRYFSWFYFLPSERNIESEHLSDEVVNLWIFTIGLTLIGCQPHMSSIWPWSGTPKVHLYGTIVSGLRQFCMLGRSARLGLAWLGCGVKNGADDTSVSYYNMVYSTSTTSTTYFLLFLISAASFIWRWIAVLFRFVTQKVCSFCFCFSACTLTQNMSRGKSWYDRQFIHNWLGSIVSAILL